MQFCFYSGFNQMLAEKGAEATASWAQEQGFSAVEFLQLDAENWHCGVENIPHAQQVKKTLRDHGLVTACYSVGVNLLEGEKAKAFLKRHAELAAELGSPFLHHTLIDSLVLPPNAPSFDEVFDQIVNAATEIALYCQTLGLTCLYEEQGLYFNGVKNLRRFFDEIKKRCQNVGICGDFGNILFADEAPEAFFRAFQKDIKHVHLKDYIKADNIQNLPDQEAWLKTKGGAYLKDVPLGEGVIDLQQCFDQLRAVRYGDFFSLEIVDPVINNPNAMRLAKNLFL